MLQKQWQNSADICHTVKSIDDIILHFSLSSDFLSNQMLSRIMKCPAPYIAY